MYCTIFHDQKCKQLTLGREESEEKYNIIIFTQGHPIKVLSLHLVIWQPTEDISVQAIIHEAFFNYSNSL